MLDRHLHPRIKPLLHQCVRVLDKPGITPDGLTLVGFAIGVLALPFLALGWYLAALVVILLNRLLDGLDGALARRRELTDAGGFLDISLDFLFYALVPFGFILAAPSARSFGAVIKAEGILLQCQRDDKTLSTNPLVWRRVKP